MYEDQISRAHSHRCEKSSTSVRNPPSSAHHGATAAIGAKPERIRFELYGRARREASPCRRGHGAPGSARFAQAAIARVGQTIAPAVGEVAQAMFEAVRPPATVHAL